jgi:hypothetical protein
MKLDGRPSRVSLAAENDAHLSPSTNPLLLPKNPLPLHVANKAGILCPFHLEFLPSFVENFFGGTVQKLHEVGLGLASNSAGIIFLCSSRHLICTKLSMKCPKFGRAKSLHPNEHGPRRPSKDASSKRVCWVSLLWGTLLVFQLPLYWNSRS